jgi:hypothetical protein
MQIELSRHARRHIRWREITEDEIIEVINNPERVEDAMHGKKNAFRKIGDRLLKVTYKHKDQKLVIITAVIKGR